MTRIACALVVTLLAGPLWAADENTATVVAEGVGKDEKEAKKAAYRDAVSKVVGTLVSAETLVKNDEIISDKILEYSGGFIKTSEVLKTDKTADGLVRVRIKATVERLQLVGKLKDNNVSSKSVSGSDLAAEKMTKEEARKNATELLTKLYEDIPKFLKADVVGKPELTDDAKGVNLTITVGADMKLYEQFVKKAMPLLEQVCIKKDSILLAAGVDRQEGGYQFTEAGRDVFAKPDLGQGTGKGYAVWLMTFIDGTGTRTRWNLYWVDAEILKTVNAVVPLTPKTLDRGSATLACKVRFGLKFNDAKGNLVTEDELDFLKMLQSDGGYRWYGAGLTVRNYEVDNEERRTVSLFISPFMSTINARRGNLWNYQPKLTFRHKVKLSDEDLERVKEIKVAVSVSTTSTDND